MEDLTTFSGVVSIRIYNAITNETKSEQTIKNLVVTTGKTFIASRMSGASASVMSHIAIGSGMTAAAVGDMTLQTELARQAMSVAGGTPSSATVTYAATFGAGVGTGTISEAGILNNSSGGTLLARTVFTGQVKAAGDSMDVSWTVTAN